jgi:ABC-type nickel/cobalt efflux system permease component RcnA
VRRAVATAIWLALCLLPFTWVIANATSQDSAASVSVPPSRGILQRWVPALAVARRDVAKTLSDRVRELGATRRPSTLASVVLLALASGALVAAGPGHGKLAIAAYFLARRTGASRALVACGVVALLQVVSAIASAAIFAGLLGRDRAGVLRGATGVELASYVLVTAVGLWLLLQAASGRVHDGTGFSVADIGFVLAAGLTPSAGALALVLFAGANEILGAGLAAAPTMALGIAVTLSAVALLSIAVRAAIWRAAAIGVGAGQRADRALRLAGALMMTVAGAVFSWDAWTSPR